jgi:hypothetical protein
MHRCTSTAIAGDVCAKILRATAAHARTLSPHLSPCKRSVYFFEKKTDEVTQSATHERGSARQKPTYRCPASPGTTEIAL